MKEKNISRCAWVSDDPDYIKYHDEEWGVPVFNDKKLFEFIILEGMQAGLSWLTILKRRKNFHACFDKFDAKKIAEYDQKKVDMLLKNPGIIRNHLKIQSVIINAKSFLQVKKEFGNFSDYIWQFTDGRPIQNNWKTHSQVPASTPQSDKMSRDLKQRGFKFVGSTICYAFMQAVGMVNDHTINCFRQGELK